jgi:hypothetical protein
VVVTTHCEHHNFSTPVCTPYLKDPLDLIMSCAWMAAVTPKRVLVPWLCAYKSTERPACFNCLEKMHALSGAPQRGAIAPGRQQHQVSPFVGSLTPRSLVLARGENRSANRTRWVAADREAREAASGGSQAASSVAVLEKPVQHVQQTASELVRQTSELS